VGIASQSRAGVRAPNSLGPWLVSQAGLAGSTSTGCSLPEFTWRSCWALPALRFTRAAALKRSPSTRPSSTAWPSRGSTTCWGDDSPTMGGGGTPFENVGGRLAAEMAQQASALSETGRIRQGHGKVLAAATGARGAAPAGGPVSATAPGIGAGFFGTKGKGKSFIYVVDMSGSMYGDRFARAKSELIKVDQ